MKPLDERLIQFAASVAKFSAQLPTNKFGTYMSDQLLRSGLSPALNYGEAQAAESRKDFIHKMKLCLKELKETNHALRICEQYLDSDKPIKERSGQLTAESRELIAIFFKAVKTARKRDGVAGR